jgi:hypothetical protein
MTIRKSPQLEKIPLIDTRQLPRSEKNKKNSGNANPHGPFVDSESDAHGVETGLRDLIPTRHRHLYLTDAARDTNPEKKQTHKKQTMKRTAPPLLYPPAWPPNRWGEWVGRELKEAAGT